MTDESARILDELFADYGSRRDPGSQENVTELLREIQETLGYIPDGMRKRAAEACGVKPSVVDLIMKWNRSLKSAPEVHRITVCTGPRCQAKGGGEILNALKKEFSGRADVRIETRNCLKQCRTAPNLLADGEPVGGLTPERAVELVRGLAGR